jgi:hypothetical protein
LRRLLKNVIELFHGMEYPQINLSRKRSFDNYVQRRSGILSHFAVFKPERGQLREHAIIRVGRPRIEIKTGVDIVIHAGQAYQGRVAGVGRRLHLLNKVYRRWRTWTMAPGSGIWRPERGTVGLTV